MPSTKSKPKPNLNYRLDFEAIGTQWQINLTCEEYKLNKLSKCITDRIAAFDAAYSRFLPESIVSAIGKEAGTFTFPGDATAMLQLYDAMFDASGGKVTPTIGDTLAAAGYDASYSLKPRPLQQPLDWKAIERQGTTLHTKQPVLLDFGAAGKGYLVDIVSEIIEAEGVAEYCVDAGGDMRYRGAQNLTVGLENPMQSNMVIGAASLHAQSLCGSAGNRRVWAGYNHILDPERLTSPRHIAALWTVADSTMLADGMATCLYFVDANKLRQRFAFEWLVYYQDGTIDQSDGFPGQLFIGQHEAN